MSDLSDEQEIDHRKPFSEEELKELLGSTLHGPLPQMTQYRLMATADYLQHRVRQLEQALELSRDVTRKVVGAMDEVIGKIERIEMEKETYGSDL